MNEEKRQREAREALERVSRDSETAGSSSLARMSQRAQHHFSGRDAEGALEGGGTDPIELWGRRIGRSLSVIGFVALVLWLLVQLGIV
jgi:ferric-dicitrate binding protein FerR (iron transport regulator)